MLVYIGCVLAAVAGALNAGGLVLGGRYVSHMTGLVSASADAVRSGQWRVAATAASLVAAFAAGAATTAILVNWNRRARRSSAFSLPLVVEAGLLAALAAAGDRSAGPAVAVMLAYVLGLQNAVVTKVSGARMRTTHVTGIVTDLGIELGKRFYRDGGREPRVEWDGGKARLLAGLLGSFFIGATAGAAGFHRFGARAAAPLAAVVLALTFVPGWDA